jgi:hypothetical protein
VLVVLLTFRAVDCRVERSFHDWWVCGDIIAKSSFVRIVFHAPIGFGMLFQ